MIMLALAVLLTGAAPPVGEPQRPLVWQAETWLADQTRLRAEMPLADSDLSHLRDLTRYAMDLFPAFFATAQRPLQPLEMRLVQGNVLNDPTYLDLGLHRTVLGAYFPGVKVAYAATASEPDAQIVLHELTHFLLDVYDVELSPSVEERQVHRFVRFVRRFEQLLAREHLDRPTAGPRGLVAGDAENPRIELEGSEDLRRRLWVMRVLATGQSVFPRHAGYRAQPMSALRVIIHRDEACRAAFSLARRSVELSLDGCAQPPNRAVQEIGHALGHFLIYDYGLAVPREQAELTAYTLGNAVETELRARGLPIALDAL